MTSVSSPPRTIRIGSRKSQLALVQTYWVQAQLQKSFPDITFEVHTMSTQGDKILDVALAKIGDKGLFTKELELSMINKEIDFAVHSLKDLPTNLPAGLTLAAITERENPADAVVLHEKYKGEKLETLPPGVVIGTSSLRRLAQLRHQFPHFTFKDVRGNLITRMAKLDAGEYDALILAVAGLERLEMSDRIHQVLTPEISLHAVGQGALGIECRADDTEVIALLKAIEHPQTRDRCLAERSFLRVLEGGCQVPIGVNTAINGHELTLKGLVASVDGQQIVKDTVIGATADAEKLGAELASILRKQGATEILEKIFTEIQRGS
ncbi:hydroxymethylbilane synthase [Aphanizomenon flos-aquae NRERC-008]|jgi:hydroxymethylbilane synthase|uniref:Porphobilinogen deaminase n=1 Tax=Aphanizomenon flos-aquae FACHB-1249 TaxID=2692889 RepID=A0ABR8IVE6_APHFL|nr:MULTISPECIES: hydroxymethylbilane synthase [Aphanizomenon]MCE2903767.1 hydroxymethylbilane synthase [Anabaena sp. CoA2_C59]MDJ0507224.1 hydroxymethylbilane synthase [Nostocales cyanobacterium LE14-WE12]MBD2392559.1 hydroxymethylbilane synthase [Aphanizomenon flos-aquae FACHB-1171]MBD2558868.1 hydroxymethylbilane synthase [Aphanizomenon flos-aquae FACHB-1290]MBD2633604.1 hydroxymethylbilane synthase [Aphanizomenon sp. FACHB-1399]